MFFYKVLWCRRAENIDFYNGKCPDQADGANSMGGGGYTYKKVGWRRRRRRRRTSYGDDAIIFVLLKPPALAPDT
jgi:hypothetical protein